MGYNSERWWETFSDSNRQWEKIILKTHHRITICCDIIIYRILDLISDDRVERPPYLDEIDGNFWIINFIVRQEPTNFLGRTNTWNSLAKERGKTMQLTSTTDYAIRIVCYLAAQRQMISTSELSQELSVPSSYIPKITKKLKQAGIIKACEGIKGGYQIAKQPENISLRDVISCTESTMAISRCLEKEGGCSKNYIAWETRRWRRCWRVWRRAWKLNKNIIMEIEQSLLALGEIQMWVDFL